MTQTVPYRYLAVVLVGFMLIVSAFLWTRGTFDYALWRFHLNYNECGQNGFGAVFCGKDLEEYKQRVGQP